MKGQMEIPGEFVKIIQIALMTIGLLSVVVNVLNFQMTNIEEVKQLNALYVGESFVSSECFLVEKDGVPIKSMFDYNKIIEYSDISDCIKAKNYYINLIYYDPDIQEIIFNDMPIPAGERIAYPATMFNGTHILPAVVEVYAECDWCGS